MLPGEQDRAVSPPQKVRLAIGSTYLHEKSGKMLPRKDDYFSVRKLSRQEKGATYLIDQELQAAMCAAAGVTEKPTAVPVTVIGNASMGKDGKTPTLPESILFAEMARYSGNRRECACREFNAEGKGTAHQRKYETKQKKGEGKGTYKVLVSEQDIPCDPKTCPFATGAQNEGVPLCKPHVIANLLLPWASSVGTVAKFKTTGWANYYGMRNSLLAIALQTNGWLHDIPLFFVLEWARSSDGQLIPEVRFEFRGNVDELRLQTIPKLQAWQSSEGQLKALQAGVIESTLTLVEDVDDQEATQVEFFPEAAATGGTVSRLVVPEVPPVLQESPETVIEGDFGPIAPEDAPDSDAPLFPLSATVKETADALTALAGEEVAKSVWEGVAREYAQAPKDVGAREYARRANAWEVANREVLAGDADTLES